MTREQFNKILEEVSINIIPLGIARGYLDRSKKQVLIDKLGNIIERKYRILGDSLADFDPSLGTMGFNLNQINTYEEAVIVILHEEKHGLDAYFDLDNASHIDNSHVGFHHLFSGMGICQNESITERFAVNMARLFPKTNIRSRLFTAFNFSFPTDMVRYQVEDRLNQIFCMVMGISLDELISMQNDENMTRLNELINRFNMFADYNRFCAAMDRIYMLRYSVDGKEDDDFQEEDIRRMHECVQTIQDEFKKYIIGTAPEKLGEMESLFIKTDPKYQIGEEQKEMLFGNHPVDHNDSSVINFMNMMREDLEEETKAQKTGSKVT